LKTIEKHMKTIENHSQRTSQAGSASQAAQPAQISGKWMASKTSRFLVCVDVIRGPVGSLAVGRHLLEPGSQQKNIKKH
jgi:hypothetical protein